MPSHLLGDAIEYVLSRFPDQVVTHFANSHSEFLRGMQACVDNCVDDVVEDIDARVEGSRRRRNEATSRETERDSARVDIEEEEDA